MKYYNALKKIFENLSQLYYCQRILTWDEAVLMPEGAGIYRAKTMGYLHQLIQRQTATKKIHTLIEFAKSENLSSWDSANLKWMERKYREASCIPLKLNTQWVEASLSAFQAWRKYREQNNWQDFLPYLEKSFNLILEIAKRKSETFQLSPYGVLIDHFSPGLTEQKIDDFFKSLKITIPDLRKQIIKKQSQNNRETADNKMLIEKQKELAHTVMQAMGFNYKYGRLDTSHHPFCDGIPVDVRVTTSYNENNFLESFYGVIHETGHALYEQGMPKEWIFQPVGQIQHKGLHESQALLFEYEVCHSYAFIKWVTEKIRQLSHNHHQLGPSDLYQSVTKINPMNKIRIHADEVSYPLHVMLRYDIERALFNGDITIKDLPDIWNEKSEKYLGISTKENYKDGVMQDMHWVFGYFGYFPSYVIGQMMASQVYVSFINNNDDFEQRLQERGDFSLLHAWLQDHFYKHGSSLSSDELIQKISGHTLNPNYFIDRMKYRYLECL